MDRRPQVADGTADVTCGLAPLELGERIVAWRMLATRATNRTVEQGRIVATYPHDPELVARLTELIAAERDCCSFLRFTVHNERDVIRLELVYPPAFEPVVTTLFEPA